MSKVMSSRGRVCRQVVSVQLRSVEANEGWKGCLRPKCGLIVSSLFANESISLGPLWHSIALYCSRSGLRCAAGSRPARRQILGQAGAGDVLSTAGPLYYQLYRLKKSPPAARRGS